MKKQTYSPYATNKIGKIESPRNPAKGDPKSHKTAGDDLRARKGK